ncbi:MAG: hypothetical protein ACREMQ_03080 [Longimicrobiales bacterium]
MSVRRDLRIIAVIAAALLSTAHIGTDDVFFVGRAGPYGVRVSIRQPGVIPGLADITVRTEGEGVQRVLVTALRRVGNLGSAPPADTASSVAGEFGMFTAQLWLMTRGPHSVIVTVEGAAGAGTATIPVMARATRRIAMTPGLGVLLAIGGLFLVLGLLTIVGAASRESRLPPDAEPSKADRWRGRFALAGGAVVLAFLLFGGWTWIRAEAATYRTRIDRTWTSEAKTRATDRGVALEFSITEPRWVMREDSAWRAANRFGRAPDLIPDHGKMMHLFLVREPDLNAFAHLHPARTDENSFLGAMPSLPAGRYRVYADVVHEDGASRSFFTTLDMATDSATDVRATPPLAADPDDAWWTGEIGDRDMSRTGNGYSIRWMNPNAPLVAGRDAELVFILIDADGAPVPLEPYIGMNGHAMLNSAGGQVFMHLHPSGSISVASQQVLDRVGAAAHETVPPAAAMRRDQNIGVVRFPFVVPAPGRYRIWVQVKGAAQVLTGAFDAEVKDRE